jgi:hypothetical protein
MVAPEPGSFCDLLMRVSEWRAARLERRNKRLQSINQMLSRMPPPPPPPPPAKRQTADGGL